MPVLPPEISDRIILRPAPDQYLIWRCETVQQANGGLLRSASELRGLVMPAKGEPMLGAFTLKGKLTQ